MRKYRRHAIVLVLVVAAVITPPDIFSQILVSLPLLLLYEASIIIAQRVVRNKEKAEAAEAEAEAAAERAAKEKAREKAKAAAAEREAKERGNAEAAEREPGISPEADAAGSEAKAKDEADGTSRNDNPDQSAGDPVNEKE